MKKQFTIKRENAIPDGLVSFLKNSMKDEFWSDLKIDSPYREERNQLRIMLEGSAYRIDEYHGRGRDNGNALPRNIL